MSFARAGAGLALSSAVGFRPTVFSLPAQSTELDALVRSGAVVAVHDTLRAQLAELVETRAPERTWTAQQADRAASDMLAGCDPKAYGRWVHYPWSGRLVHVLPPDQFFELRTSRNRNKITREEQGRLGKLKVGVAGLSAGQATALTLALEGIGGEMRLADFDVLSLSNMNRLRAGVHEIGVNKAVITAREIFEINPYAVIDAFEDGVTDDNIGRFLESLDLLFEECDDLKMKVRLREEARRRRIPVLMETSDRGLFDVERFDREPDRALFHGLAGELRAEELAGLTTYEKVPIVLSIIGAHTMSTRLAASLVDIEATLKTWPQLASAIALGGAVNADAARRIGLGQFHASGRYFVDLEQIVADGTPHELAGDPSGTAPTLPQSAPAAQPARSVSIASGPLRVEQLHALVRWAALAPSGGNCQPWRFVYRTKERALECWHEPSRSKSFLDFEHRATYAAFGALAENLRLACATQSLALSVVPFPDAQARELVCVARFEGVIERTAEDVTLAEWVPQRVTNRKLGRRTPLPDDLARALVDIAARAGGRLQLLTEPDTLAAFADVHGETERLRMLHPQMHDEMMHELRWSRGEAQASLDGIDVATLELTATDHAGLNMLRSAAVARTLRFMNSGEGLKQPSRKAMAAASAVGLVTVRGSSPRDYFRGGCVMQRVWLWANARGFSLQPMTALVYVFARLAHGGEGLDGREREAFSRARKAYQGLFDVSPDVGEVLAFRLALADPPSARALRRGVEDLLEIRD